MSMQMDGDAMEQQGAVSSQDAPVLPCLGCGGLVPNVPGPAHPYIQTSPGCWQVYGEAVARWYADPLAGPGGDGMAVSTCPGCGLTASRRAGPPSAPAPERHTASDACWSLYGELLSRSYSDADYRRAHQLVVDAYTAQHAGPTAPGTPMR